MDELADTGVGADILAIGELHARIRQMWPGLTEPAREDLAEHLALLHAAVEQRDTDSRAVRETLQTVLLTVGTGALATLSAAGRRQLTALTGIALPDRGAR